MIQLISFTLVCFILFVISSIQANRLCQLLLYYLTVVSTRSPWEEILFMPLDLYSFCDRYQLLSTDAPNFSTRLFFLELGLRDLSVVTDFSLFSITVIFLYLSLCSQTNIIPILVTMYRKVCSRYIFRSLPIYLCGTKYSLLKRLSHFLKCYVLWLQSESIFQCSWIQRSVLFPSCNLYSLHGVTKGTLNHFSTHIFEKAEYIGNLRFHTLPILLILSLGSPHGLQVRNFSKEGEWELRAHNTVVFSF